MIRRMIARLLRAIRAQREREPDTLTASEPEQRTITLLDAGDGKPGDALALRAIGSMLQCRRADGVTIMAHSGMCSDPTRFAAIRGSIHKAQGVQYVDEDGDPIEL